jgi:hypothetical protein
MIYGKSQHSEVASAVSKARSAYRDGKLNHYKPLAASGAGEVKSTCPTSWGPAMRR